MRWLLTLPVAIWRRLLLIGQGLIAISLGEPKHRSAQSQVVVVGHRVSRDDR